MKFSLYIKDKFLDLLIFTFTLITLILTLLVVKTSSSIIILVCSLLITYKLTTVLLDYFRKREFYTTLLENIQALDKAYLVLETMKTPHFYEGELFASALYEINKSFLEVVNSKENYNNDFKEYIEMWIHEVKIPLSALTLIAHNKNKLDNKALDQIAKIEYYVEQVLYYVRSENTEKDYLINEVKLNKVINSIALKNKDLFLEHNIDFITKNTNMIVLTDSKWLEFILNQIINNSIKYTRANVERFIKIEGIENEKSWTIEVTDNGIGIRTSDLPRVFDKSFTGTNGRIYNKSTGMGLFIAKKLCDKLGSKISIDSKENEYTKVSITIPKNDYYNVTKK